MSSALSGCFRPLVAEQFAGWSSLGRKKEIGFGEAEMSEPLADRSQGNEPTLDVGFDSYRSLANSNIRIIVAKDVVPPFRFKAGGWEFLHSSAEPGSAIRARVAEKGFFLFRVNEDQTGGTELTDFPPPSHDGVKVE